MIHDDLQRGILFAVAPGSANPNKSGASGAEKARCGAEWAELRPYYSHAGITIYHGDCRVILPRLEPFDLLLTDPPYGIGESSKKNATRGTSSAKWKRAGVRDYGAYDWDKEPVEEWVMCLARRLCRSQIIFGGNYYDLPPAKCWLIWDKENTGDFADGEMAWTNLDKAVRIKRHMWNGFQRVGSETRYHPTQKPSAVMMWALELAGDVQTVLDPWMGSGTTLRVCKDSGKQCVGIEREERYCEIAAKRLEQECLSLGGGGAEQVGDGNGESESRAGSPSDELMGGTPSAPDLGIKASVPSHAAPGSETSDYSGASLAREAGGERAEFQKPAH